MPTQAKSARRYVAVAAIAGALALGATLAFPGVGQAQTEETTTTTAVEETTEPTTETTVPSDQSSDEARQERGDKNCDYAEEETTTSDT